MPDEHVASEETQDACEMVDSFASTASKYQFLFELTRDAAILFIGQQDHQALEDFRHHFKSVVHVQPCDNILPASGRRGYDLIWLDADDEGGRACASVLTTLACDLLSEAGCIVVTFLNRHSCRSIRDFLGLRPSACRPSSVVRASAQTALRRAGLKSVQLFLVSPYAGTPLELVAAKVNASELASNEGRIGRFLAWLGLYRYAHPRYALVARRQTGFLAGFKNHLHQCLRPAPGSGAEISIDRAFLRVRGALVLSVVDKSNGLRYVCRVATTGSIDEVISRNARVLKRVHDLAVLGGHKQQVPRPLHEGTYAGSRFYLETELRGLLAWRVAQARPATSARILKDSLAFIHQFHAATRRAALVTPRRYQALLGADLERLAEALASLGIGSGLAVAINERMKRYFLHRGVFVVWGHGDYGLGNLLCAPADGTLQGVIDWDTFRAIELPAVDYLNLLLQKARQHHDGAVSGALRQLWKDIDTEGPITAAVIQEYGRSFALTRADFRLYCSVAALRIVTRSIPYVIEFQQSASDYVKVLQNIGDALAPSSEARGSAESAGIAVRT